MLGFQSLRSVTRPFLWSSLALSLLLGIGVFTFSCSFFTTEAGTPGVHPHGVVEKRPGDAKIGPGAVQCAKGTSEGEDLLEDYRIL